MKDLTLKGLLKDELEAVNADNLGAFTSPTPVTTEPLTYEQWYSNNVNSVNNSYNQSVSNAETAKLKAINDARNSYEHNLSTYGSNAAALGSMGLSGSGYSRYLDSKAYAQMRGDMNAANSTYQNAVDNANATKQNSLLQLQGTYMDYLNQQDAQKKQVYTDLYSNVGSYSEADIDRLAGQYGLSAQQINDLKAARTERVVQALNSSDYTKSDLKNLFPNGGALYEQYLAKLGSMIDNVTAADFTTENGMMSASDAKAKLEALKASGVNTENAEKVYNSLYGIGITGGYQGAYLSSEWNAKSGSKLKINAPRMEGETNERVVELGEKVTDSNSKVMKATSGLVFNDGQVFYYDGELYIYKSGYLYTLKKKGNNSDYDTLLEQMKNSK